MTDDEMAHFAGKRVGDMTREELIAAVGILGRLLQDAHKRTESAWAFAQDMVRRRD